MRPRIIWTIFCKELTEALRDRITLAVVLGLPLLLYPVMIISLSKVQRSQAASEDRRVSRITIWGESPALLLTRLQRTNTLALLAPWLAAPAGLRADIESGRLAPPPPPPPVPGAGEDETTTVRRPRQRRVSQPAPEHPVLLAARRAVTQNEADAVLIVWPGTTNALAQSKSGKAWVLYDAVKPASEKAANRLADELSAWRREVVRERLHARGLPDDFVTPLDWRSQNVAPPSRTAGHMLGFLLPFVLVMLSATGALYASIDLTAGEKDRATMQTLLCAPVHSLEIVAGKFCAVWLISLIAASVNSASLGGTFARLSASGVPLHVSPLTFLLAFACLLPITCTVSAFFMAVAMMARDAKDAGHFLGTSLSLILMPMGVTLVPGVELNAATCFVPLVNIALLIKAIFIGEARPDLVFLALLGASLYAMLALLFAARAFSREQILLSGRGSFRSLFESGRAGPAPGTATPVLALVSFALILVAMFYGSLLFEKAGLIPMVLATQYGCFLLPVALVVLLKRLPLRETLSLRRPHWQSALGSLLLGASSGLAIAGWALRLLPAPESLAKGMEKLLLLGDTPAPLWIVWGVVALTPALCEEMVFRGLILSGLRRLGPATAIGLSALLFGLAHASVYRLLPTLGLGLVLGYTAWRTGSIYCSILIHALNNGLIATLVHEEALAGRLQLSQASVLPWSITLGATAVMIFGLWLLRPPPGNST